MNFQNFFAQHGYDAHFLVIAVRAVLHPLLICLAQEQIGDEGSGIGVIGLAGDERNLTRFIDDADALNTAGGGGGIAQ